MLLGGVKLGSEALRFPAKYLANLLTAGDEAPIISAINRMLAMRSYQRSVRVEGQADLKVLERAGITEAQAKEMYRYLAIANYEDRFVIPTAAEEWRLEDPYAFQGQNGFSPGNTSSNGTDEGFTLFPTRRQSSAAVPLEYVPPPRRKEKA